MTRFNIKKLMMRYGIFFLEIERNMFSDFTTFEIFDEVIRGNSTNDQEHLYIKFLWTFVLFFSCSVERYPTPDSEVFVVKAGSAATVVRHQGEFVVIKVRYTVAHHNYCVR